MTTTSHYTQVCFDAWIHCENLLTSVMNFRTSLSRKVTKTIDECALICMGTFHAIKSSSQNINRMALLCVGICEECAEICEAQDDARFRHCARVCRECSNSMSKLAFTDLQ
jgi:hypothetical protein